MLGKLISASLILGSILFIGSAGAMGNHNHCPVLKGHMTYQSGQTILGNDNLGPWTITMTTPSNEPLKHDVKLKRKTMVNQQDGKVMVTCSNKHGDITATRTVDLKDLKGKHMMNNMMQNGSMPSDTNMPSNSNMPSSTTVPSNSAPQNNQ